MRTPTINRKVTGGIDFVDITFMILLFMSWVFLANAWKDPLANTMLGITSLLVSFYLIARYTGALQFLELTKPFWTISALISIPIWLGTFALLPQPQGSFQSTAITPNVLETFISPETTTIWLQAFNFGTTESILAGILASFFIGVGAKRAKGNVKKQTYNIIGVILLIAIFMSFIHISIVAKVAEAGVYESGILFGHQVLTFGILLILGLLTPFGMVGIIAPHIMKNVLVYAQTPGIWIAVFSVFIVMDILSMYFAKQKERAAYNKQISQFVP